MRHGSLFSGIGGFDLAAQWMGWENVFHCEWMEFPRKVLEYHFPNADSLTDITKTNFKKYANTIDIISGGFPCQPFSMAGKRKGKKDERYLWDEMLRAIQEIKPKFVVAENVSGLVSIDEGLVFNKIITDLENEGYEVQSFIIPACSKNAPHRRDRVWFIAYNNSIVWGEGRKFKSRKQSRHRESNESCNTKIDGNATNTNSGGIQTRQVREILGESNSERQTRGFINDALQGDATNTNSNGFHKRNSENEESSTNTRFDALCHSDKGNGNGITTDTQSNGNREQFRKNKERKDRLINHDGKDEIATDTSEIGLPTEMEDRELVGDKRLEFGSERNAWDSFPTQSPICSGNDGISERLDNITFPKWRAESIKAYGNAVVPQVVYELFQIIEELNNNTDQ